jgi:hypothetical protein
MSKVSSLVLVLLALTAVFFAGNISAVYKVVAKPQVKSAMRKKPMTITPMYTMHKTMAAPPARKTMAAAPAYRSPGGGRSVAKGPLVGLENVPMYSPSMVPGRRFGA